MKNRTSVNDSRTRTKHSKHMLKRQDTTHPYFGFAKSDMMLVIA